MKKYLIYFLGLLTIINTAMIIFNKPKNSEVIVERNIITSVNSSLTSAFKDVDKYLVLVQSDKGIANGFIYKQKEDKVYILTNYHAVLDSTKINVLLDNFTNLEARLLAFDLVSDLAVLEIESDFKLKPLAYDINYKLKKAEYVIAAYKAQNENFSSLNLGIVSNPLKMQEFTIDNQKYYLAISTSDIKLNSGASGSPLLNINGELVGLNFARSDKDELYSIPLKLLEYVANTLIDEGKTQYNNLKLQLIDIHMFSNYQKASLSLPLDHQKGLMVEKIDLDSPLINKLKTKDILLTYDNKEFEDLIDYQIFAYEYQNIKEIEVLRENERIVIKLHD